MITNFEEITGNLNAEEYKLIPVLIKNFQQHTSENPVKAPDIVKGLNKWLPANGYEIQMTQPRLRKCCNFIRSMGMIPLIATKNGYYVSHDQGVIAKQIKSLRERAAAILACADGLMKFIKPLNE